MKICLTLKVKLYILILFDSLDIVSSVILKTIGFKLIMHGGCFSFSKMLHLFFCSHCVVLEVSRENGFRIYNFLFIKILHPRSLSYCQVEQLEQEVSELRQALSDKQEQENAMLQVSFPLP